MKADVLVVGFAVTDAALLTTANAFSGEEDFQSCFAASAASTAARRRNFFHFVTVDQLIQDVN
jgi:hypothetical protein